MTRFTVICAVVVVACSFSLKSMATRIYMQNHCGVTVCGRYWGNKVGGSCSGLSPRGIWTVTASPNWKGVSMWAIKGGGCELQHCNEPGPHGAFTEFVISVDDSTDHEDSYNIFRDPERFNVAMKAKPTTAGCPTILCNGRDIVDSYQDLKVCPTGTDYFLELCPPY